MALNFELHGKTALVTGASRGIGQALAVGLAQSGATVICASSRKGGCDDTLAKIEELGLNAYALSADLSDADATRALADEALTVTGSVDILVNNGGTIYRAPATEFPLEQWQKVMQVNIDSAFILSQAIGKAMVKHGRGKIINIASMLSYSGGITVPAYTASKHAIAGLTKALANEWGQHNIQVNAIAPGYIRTDNTQALQDDSERSNEILKRIPANRWGEAEDLQGAAVFLASDASAYVNGHILAVDGGFLAR
ncbi:2-dehydro-3-deoxy-D-gluconate 5-dehydrogenase KduD [Alteromonas macleodii]|uniref:2-dehydro-3-deoxy-D-gluconate 5-dehydrogenase KduD n=1 Tax=Alteromonas macleodii TaxID=28108 RepID=UPI00066C6E73|nr:2-dehydro-3-deoxy-D-gluconate 5-dehydrogenase KduD [Alteromonas macleodii]CAI3966392.1 2-deoxy-D-gluconate 3-dehydrogenase [Alteromonas macleodii]VTP55123.1 2-deoxy-D-gluconate 3-dehydrogenase [Alteromonas macleodii]